LNSAEKKSAFEGKGMNIRSFLMFVLSAVFIATAVAKDPPSIRRTMQDEVRRHPRLQMQDLYKFAYQAAMGNEHMMADSAGMEKYLRQEMDTLTAGETEDLVEYLTPDSSAARVNLRPYKKMNGSTSHLVSLMIKSTHVFTPSKALLRIYLNDIEKLADDDMIPFKVENVQAYFKQMQEKQFPPMHHSSIFEETYHPAYRVIAGCCVSGLRE
jgi:hypothetical protein